MRHRRITQRLLDWFAANARDLPWRRTHDPYAVWVSEIMLQQTQVKTVLPYWERWMHALPTIRALAMARPARLHKLWEGLGYYTRVRNMHKAARVVLAEHGGRFPSNYDGVLALPGIGRYTAGAICSIAFNQPRPILDGNVIRVLTRLFGLRGNPREKKTNAALWELAGRLVQEAANLEASRRALSNRPSSNPCARNCSSLNQALMELGALVCTPREPRCGDCPVRRGCVALRQKCVDRLPNLGRRASSTERRFVAFLLRKGERYLVCQRPAGVVNAHLWEFPNVELNNGERVPERAFRGLVRARACDLEPFCTLRHTITRYRITLEVFRISNEIATMQLKADGRWLTPDAMERLAFASAHRKVLEKLRGSGGKLSGKD